MNVTHVGRDVFPWEQEGEGYWRYNGGHSLVLCRSVFIQLTQSPLPFLSSLIMSNTRAVHYCTSALFLYERQNSVHPQTVCDCVSSVGCICRSGTIDTGLTLSKSLRKVTT